MNSRFLIGVAGGSGSGKTSLLRKIQADLGEERVTILSQDDYYLPIELQEKDDYGEVNFDLPLSIDTERLLKDVSTLLNGQEVVFPRYLFNNTDGIAEEIRLEPRPIILIEGLFVFHYPALCQMMVMKVFVDAQEDIRLKRRIERDESERGYKEDTVRYQWANHVEPAFHSYLLPHRTSCDVVVKNNVRMEEGYTELKEQLDQILESAL
jgi:uridine kinase